MVFAVNMQLMTEVIYSLDNVDISSMTHAYSSLGKIEAGNDIIDSFIRLADLLNKSYNDIKVLYHHRGGYRKITNVLFSTEN